MGVIYGWNWKLPNGRVNPDALPKAQHSSKSQVLNRRKTKRTRKTRKPTNWVEFPGIGYVNLASSNQAQINNQIELGRSLAVGTFPQLYRVNNDTKVIRSSSLTSSIRSGNYNPLTNQTKNRSLQDTPIYLCSDNSTGLCSQNEPPESPIDIPYIFDNGTQSLRQNGVQLRFRPLEDTPLWDSIYVPQSLLSDNIINVSASETDISINDQVNIYSIDLKQVLPNGSYQIEYDVLINSNANLIPLISINKSNPNTPFFPNCNAPPILDTQVTIPENYPLPVMINIKGSVNDDLLIDSQSITTDLGYDPGPYPDSIGHGCVGSHTIGSLPGPYKDLVNGGITIPINKRTFTVSCRDTMGSGAGIQVEINLIPTKEDYIIRITDTVNIENSQKVLFNLILEESAPKLLSFTGNINDPTYNINYSNTEKFNNFIDNIVNETYNICTTQNTSGDGNTQITIPKTLALINPTTNIEYYENYNVLISMITKYDDITYFSLTITSEIPRNNNYVAFAREYSTDDQESNIAGWLAPSFNEAAAARIYDPIIDRFVT